MPSGAAIPRASLAIISIPAGMFIPGEVQPRISDMMQKLNMKPDQIEWEGTMLWLWNSYGGVYACYRVNITRWTVLP